MLFTLRCSYFETEDWRGIPGQWWFGGGTDITPNYIVKEDLEHFHGVYKVGRARRWLDDALPVQRLHQIRAASGLAGTCHPW